MAQVTKITFSEAELDAILQPDFFYVKHAATGKLMELLSETERSLRTIVLSAGWLEEFTDTISPKIFRGENYRQLPYIVLDYPRKFSTESIFAFRTMFWWGKEFSFTLHLQGKAWEHFRNISKEKFNLLANCGFYISVNDSPWQYYFEADNYAALDELIKDDENLARLLSKNFIKLSRKIPVSEFQQVPLFAAETFSRLLKILK